jgi:PAS domain S-box-containing protein
VLNTLVESAARLCDADHAWLFQREGESFHWVASYGHATDVHARIREYFKTRPVPVDRGSVTGRVALEASVVQVTDVLGDPQYTWSEAQKIGGYRAVLGAPLLRKGSVVGVLFFAKTVPQPFTAKQIELVTIFADQALIAIENTRLLKELRDSEQRYGLVTEAATEGVYEWNIETNDLYVSPRLNDLFEFKAGELTSQDWSGRVHPDERESYRRALVAHFKGAEPHLQCEYRILVKSGEYRWVLDHGLAVRNQAGRAVRLVGSVSDISAQKTAEMALRESDERYALAMEAVNESVYDWDIRSGEIFYSPRLYAVLGILPEQLKTAEDWLRRIHPDDLSNYKQAMRAHFKGETSRFACEYRYRGGDDSWRWARQHGLALRDAAGRAYRMAGSTGDITEQRETALALEQARTRLTEAIEAVSEGFALFDAQDRLVLCNSRFREFYAEVADLILPGTPFEQMLQATVGRDIISGTQHRGEEWIRERLQRHRHPAASHEYQLNDGRWLKISERMTAEGGIVGVYTDITELKKRETQLNELVEGLAQARDEAEQARTRLFDAIESIKEGFVLFDAEDRIVLCNSEYRRFFAELAGVEIGNLVVEGMRFEDFLRAAYRRGMFPDAGDDIDAWTERILRHRRNPTGPRERPLSDGRWLHISDRRTEDGGLVAVYTDITEVKRREAQTSRACRPLSRSSR